MSERLPRRRSAWQNGLQQLPSAAWQALQVWQRADELAWQEHFTFARAASAHKIQHLGNEAGLPGVDDVERAMLAFAPKA